MRPLPFLVLTLLAFTWGTSLHATNATDKSALAADQKSPEPPAATASAKEDDNDFKFDIPVPEGQPVKGVKIPYYGADGTSLQMVFEAEVARRVDDTNIEMDNLKIDANTDDNKKLFVEMPHSIFNMESRILSGDQGVTIRRDDFEITGTAGEFDIRKRFGKVLGNVKMVIYNLE